ncbi:hypothetical protein Amet_4391 [Alkaliphilus metalliredigens QYMF]|uniref:Uncharacterized protein n=1 Tax=Alkaliphilus metalliredigens (strain QYMF) TaxID=293826 RepID=A6TKA1_ALKMQ|nr:hypothetical protein [Alkaliphilus metalliredigens]ABR46619.1 hypothetical protein Amet_0391 [Alkaliphilus metalliredigens QYMF]ABR48092.1 hypothetical protein Amet_1929 [Alkaliphilus metalliredigens QYMF]ABR50465.1 hypothetical protein Amet_4391 [Alkaliphilus metalliredigens QYMF]
MEDVLIKMEGAAQRKRLEENLKVNINSLVEGLETKERTIEEIKNYIEKEYIGKGALKLFINRVEAKGNVGISKGR